MEYQRQEITQRLTTQNRWDTQSPEINSVHAVVVAVTAYTNDATLSRCYEVGMVEVMSKPVDSDTLQNFVNTYYRGNLL